LRPRTAALLCAPLARRIAGAFDPPLSPDGMRFQQIPSPVAELRPGGRIDRRAATPSLRERLDRVASTVVPPY